MITDIYFALASGISLRGSVPRYATALLDGRWHDAHAAVAGVADGSARQLREGDPRILAMSDVMSLLGFDEEAEQYYARALRTCRDSDQALRMLSCRNAGWQALRRDRFRVARNCFLRIARDRDATPAQRVEACIGLTLTDHGLGQQQSAAQALDHARQFAADADDKLWGLATELLSLDLQVQTGVRTTGTLADHVFWRTAYASGAPIVARGASDPAAPSVRTAGQLHDAPPLIQRQVEYLAALATTAGGDAGALRRLGELIDESRQQGIGDVLRRMRIEALLAALAGGFATAAEHLFNAIGARQPGGKATPYVDLDLLYASAKIAAMRGEMLEAFTQYTTYSHEALHRLRSEALTWRMLDPCRTAATQTRGDDVSARLPAKYRRAYWYIIENIGNRALTTREVAACIDVTERALQIVFKRCLGMTPGEVIRRVRMEGIRDELTDETGSNATVLETAHRWGMTSRSALTKSYRRYFDESPTKTIDG